MKGIHQLILLGTVCVGAACSGGTINQNSGISAPVAMPLFGPRASMPMPARTAATLYVLDMENTQEGVVRVYKGRGASYLRSVRPESYSGPVTFAVDYAGRLYASALNEAVKQRGTMNVYVNRGGRLIRKIQQPSAFAWPTLDSVGNLYTMCPGAKICEYAGGKNQITRRFKQVVGPLATDASGDLVASRCRDQGAEACVFAPNQETPYWTITDGIDNQGATGYAFDSSGTLYVANEGNQTTSNPGNVAVYAPMANSPTRLITNNVAGPVAIKIDAQGNLYVYNECAGTYDEMKNCSVKGGSIVVYASGAESPFRTITNGVEGVTPPPWVGYGSPLAVDTAGYIYIVNSGILEGAHVTVYQPGGGHPLRSITDLQDPLAVDIGP
jgi:hypothetical protein